jgi:uroporphyrinogen-III synthase
MPLRKPLTGRVIAVPEARELERLSAMLEEKGATTLRYPLVATSDTLDVAAVKRWLDELARGEIDDLVLMTAEGVRRLHGVSRGAGIAAAFRRPRVRCASSGCSRTSRPSCPPPTG